VKANPDFNDTFRTKGEDAARARADSANRYNGQTKLSLSYVDISLDPIPTREWAVLNRIPNRNVTLVSGEGAVGKSLLMLQLSAATVLGRDWIGTMPAIGPVVYLNCEDDGNEICRRLQGIATHYNVTRKEMASQLHVISLVGHDAVLAGATKDERIKTTPLFDKLRADVRKIKPRLTVVDTVSDVFAGNENDRAQTRQFINIMRNLAIEADGAVILVSHPSLTGISSRTGLSGSTAWHNSVRARAYFTKVEKAPDLRVLEWHKNNYGPASESITLRWRNGVYAPEPRAGSFEQVAADAKIENLFLDLLRRFTKQGRNVTDKPSSTYAPAVFANEPEAKNEGVKSDQLAQAMRRLFADDKIKVVSYGPRSRLRSRIVEVASTDINVAQIRTRVVGEAPGATCLQCHSNEPPVLKIKNAAAIGSKSETLHERCAEEWFASRQ
jgi:RecA-family ATPase